MSNFDRVLSDDEVDSIVKNTTMLLGQSIARSKDFILKVEQAVLAKLAAQEPVAWRINVKRFCGNFTKDKATAQYLLEKEPANVTPLYAHPMPCVSPASDKTDCVSKNGESDIQRHVDYIKRYQNWRRGEDKTMSEAGINPNQLGESLDWLIAFAENHIADKRKMVDVDHIPDIGQMVPEEKTIEQHRAEFEAHWHNIQSHGLDNGWLGVAWAAWKAARGVTE